MDINEIHPPLTDAADEAPHDKYCAKIRAIMPDDLRGTGCFCPTFAMIRADELMQDDKLIQAAPDLASAKKATTTRLLQHLMVALLPAAGAS